LSCIVLFSTMATAGLSQCFLLFVEAAYGIDRTGSAGLFIVLAMSGLCTQMFVMPVVMPRMTITTVLTTGLGLQLVQGILLTFVHSKVSLVVSCILGGFGSIVFPCVCALKSNAAPEHEQGRVQGAVSSLQSAAMGIGPVMFGALFAYLTGSSVPGGQPRPAATWGLSIFVLVVALYFSATLHRYLPEDLKHPPPAMPRRAVSIFRLRRGSSSPMTRLNEGA